MPRPLTRAHGLFMRLTTLLLMSACVRDPAPSSGPQWQPAPQPQGWSPAPQGWSPQPQVQQQGSPLVQPDVLGVQLADRINAYRVSRGLPSIPRSRALGIVAATHARDLARNYRGGGDSCNMHSWSQASMWSGCCYTPDHAQSKCMWQKPKELTGFPGFGYEVSASSSGSIDPDGALRLWQSSSGHHAVILNQGMWANSQWRSIGAAIYGGFAVAWFAKEADAAGGY